MRVSVTEYLDIELPTRRWICNRCNTDLVPADRSYNEGCLVANRIPRDVHPVIETDEHFNFSFDPEWVRLIELYCPGCGTLVETEYLPPGHPLTWDIELDFDAFERRHMGESCESATEDVR